MGAQGAINGRLDGRNFVGSRLAPTIGASMFVVFDHSSLEVAPMSVATIRTEINRLFGDMTRDKDEVLLDLWEIVLHTEQFIDALEDENFADGDDDDNEPVALEIAA